MAVTDVHGTQTTVIATRSVADGVTNTTTLLTSATIVWVAGDVNRILTGSADFVAGTYVASRTNATDAVLSVAETGSHSGQTINVTSEFVLADTSAAGTYVASVDLNAMAAGDIVELRLYEMTLTAGTRRVAYYQRYDGAQPTDSQIAISVPISTALTDTGAVRLTLTQTKGTARAFPWNLKKFA